jgi:UDP-N-acetylmuramoyl-tripeptide--D-alanyl-D-alanine ligase
MIALTLAEIASVVGGSLHLGGTDATGETIVDGTVTTDSREIGPGDVFFAKRGEFDDGHRFAPAAVERGAALLVV